MAVGDVRCFDTSENRALTTIAVSSLTPLVVDARSSASGCLSSESGPVTAAQPPRGSDAPSALRADQEGLKAKHSVHVMTSEPLGWVFAASCAEAIAARAASGSTSCSCDTSFICAASSCFRRVASPSAAV